MFRKTAVAGLVAGVFGTLALTPAAHAATIVDWNLLGAPGDQVSTAPSSAASGITGTAITRGAGLAPSAAGNSFSASGWSGQTTDYFSFGFNVASGSTVDLDSLYIGTRSSATGPGTIGLYYSGDGFTSALTTISQAPGANFVNSVLDLTDLPDLSGNVEFRLYQVGAAAANGGATTSGTGTFRVTGYFVGSTFDRNMQFTGTVSTAAIPEPSAAWLALAGLLGLGGLVRRPRAAA